MLYPLAPFPVVVAANMLTSRTSHGETGNVLKIFKEPQDDNGNNYLMIECHSTL